MQVVPDVCHSLQDSGTPEANSALKLMAVWLRYLHLFRKAVSFIVGCGWSERFRTF
jgi:hypothetical protein